MIAAVCLISSGQANAQLTAQQSATITNLQNSSLVIKNQISSGIKISNNLSTTANNYLIADPNIYQTGIITDAQVKQYNSSLSTFQATNFYTARQLLEDNAKVNKTLMQNSISELAKSAVALQSAVTVNQISNTANDSPTAQAAQAAITASGLNKDIKQSDVASYNTSLANVNEYATKAGAFLAAANNKPLTDKIDLSATNYNKSLYNSSVTYGYSKDMLNIEIPNSYSLSFTGFLKDSQVSATQFFQQPQIYGDR
jgi:hypothetical protein